MEFFFSFDKVPTAHSIGASEWQFNLIECVTTWVTGTIESAKKMYVKYAVILYARHFYFDRKFPFIRYIEFSMRAL